MNALALQYTGERVIPDRFALGDRILQEHMARYRYAGQKIKQYIEQELAALPISHRGLMTRRPMILDAPCGTGYGAAMLAEIVNATVYGLDIDSDTLEYARARYGSQDGRLCFEPACDMDEDTGWPYLPLLDAAVCFEGIEHVQNQQEVAGRLCRSVHTGGLVIVSTPRVHGPGSGSEYHTRELTLDQFTALFAPELSQMEVFGQEMQVGDCLADENARFYILVGRR
jgi:2-polyprenyl-3-methyl-5-hydroxy-6-metoxy-1,4-benzoquinol methylase